MTEAVIRLPRLHQAQKAALKGAKRFNVGSAGRRFGKSVLAKEILINQKNGALDGFPVAYCAPTYRLMGAFYDDLRRTLKTIIKSANASNHQIQLINGGSFELWTLQDQDAGRSRKYSVVVVDECAHVSDFEPIWTKSLRPTLADYQGSAWFLSSPNGFNYYKTGLFDRGDPTNKLYDENWASFTFPTSANPYINKQEIIDAQKELPELAFAQEFSALFTSVEGALLRPSYIKEGTPPDNVPLKTVVGVDLAISKTEVSDFTAIVVLSQCPKGNLYVREVTRFKGTFNEILLEIGRVCTKWKPQICGIEKVAFQSSVIQELLRTTTINAIGIVPVKDKVTRFQPLVSRYEQGLIYHDPKLIVEFEKELLVFPMSPKSPDMVDAFAYAFQSLNYTKAMPMTMQIPSL